MLDTVKEKLEVNKLVSMKKELIFIEGEMIVPDTKPDVLNTIDTSGVICLNKKEVQDERISMTGVLNAYIMYLPESEKDKVRGINTSIDFSEIIKITECRIGMESTVNAKIKTMEARVINERKVSVKASIELEINIYQKEDVEVITAIENVNNIQMLKEDLKVNSLVGSGNTKSFVKELISVDNVDNIAEILRVETYVCSEDIKVSYNKILVKSEMYIKIVYLTEDSRINTKNTKIPIVGFIDIENVVDENICDISYEVKNFMIKPNQMQENSVHVEAEIDVLANVYEEKQINLIQDIYSTSQGIKCNDKNISTMKNKRKINQLKQIRESLSIEELGNKEIIDVEVSTNILNENQGTNYMIYECQMNFKFILLDEKMQIEIKEINIDFEHRIDNIENTNVELKIEVENKDFIIQDGNLVNANVDLMMKTNEYGIANINIIDELELINQEVEEDYNVVIYSAKKEDTLWSIAKQFGSTIESIQKYNSIDEKVKIKQGDKMFIPKYIEIEEEAVVKNMMVNG